MPEQQTPESQERRSFLTGLNAGAAALAGIALGSATAARAQSTGQWQPAMHDKDAWLEVPSKHRILIDTVDVKGAGEGVLFAANYLRVNKSEYNVEATDVATVVVVRHDSVSFGYNDAMWAKYGAHISAKLEYKDPKTGEVPKVNVYNATGYGDKAPNLGTTIDSLAKQGVRFAVCGMATRQMASIIAKATGGKMDDIIAELGQNLIPNARMVPAGIVVVARAQERGYALVKA